jgi:NAD(P)-dependent dehydrogenase (short-subunit alcohol dehydrogenase family)
VLSLLRRDVVGDPSLNPLVRTVRVRVMQKQGSGSIINISSTYGHEGAAGASVMMMFVSRLDELVGAITGRTDASDPASAASRDAVLSITGASTPCPRRSVG